MKLCLMMMIQRSDFDWLEIHLPVYAHTFDGLYIISDFIVSRPEEFYLRAWTGDIPYVYVQRAFNDNWADYLNSLIGSVEQPQRLEQQRLSEVARMLKKPRYDAVMRLDPDELIFPEAVETTRKLLEKYDIVSFPRHNFWMDRHHTVPALYPDYQTRAWKLGRGIHYEGKRHESLTWDNGNISVSVPEPHIYHYGDIYLPNILNRDLKYLNYARIDAGHEPLLERPADRPVPHRDSVLFTERQPLDPSEVGEYAPFEVKRAKA